MTRIRFSDGAQLEYRVEHRSGGYYVVGQCFLCPVTNKADGERLIADLIAARRKRRLASRARAAGA
jgi:hypothetical protein